MQATGVARERQAPPLVRAPDALTALRIPLAALFVWWPDPGGRLAVLVVAALSDFADGIWARRIGGSRLGVVLDPVCDKLFMVATFAVVLASGRLALLEFVGVLLRDVVAALGFFGSWLLGRPTALPARAGGKVVTVCQFLTLAAFVARPDLVRPMAWATAAVSVYAILDYGRAAWAWKR